MPQQIIISSTPEEVRMGLVNNGILQEFMVERAMSAHLVGSIFLGRVSNIVKGIQAAFIDIGLERNAFLYLGDSKDLTEGASVIIQITKDPRGTKGPTASREITFPGHYAVLFPFSEGLGEKIKPPGMGIVLRTEAEGIGAEVLETDISNLLAEWNVVEARVKRAKAPAFLHRELDLSVRMVRDYFTRDVKEIVVDNPEAFQRIQALLAEMKDAEDTEIKLWDNGEDVFSGFGLGDTLASLADRRVELPSGGYLVIDHTEAMTVIDVNSGSYSGKNNLEETIMEINRQAAREIAHQLRLRDIGGIIVVDFIDMHSEENRQEVLAVLEDSFAGDKMRPRIQDITVLNLVEITRKKSRQNLEAVLFSDCPVCSGSGRVQSKEAIALEIKRRIRGLLKKQGSAKEILVVTHPLETEYLQQYLVKDWNRELSCHITVEPDASLHVEAFMILDNSGN